MKDHSKIFEAIKRCESSQQLRNYMSNARAKGETEIERAAFRRLISLIPSEEPGTIEFDFWRTINAFEHVLKEERGKTVRLARTRQKVNKVGVIATLRDWARTKGSTDGFDMLIARNMPEYTGEAIVLRHPEAFDEETVAGARRRLVDAGVDVDRLRSPD
jgi:hypothetical protein